MVGGSGRSGFGHRGPLGCRSARHGVNAPKARRAGKKEVGRAAAREKQGVWRAREGDKQGMITRSSVPEEERRGKIATSLATVNKHRMSARANRSGKSGVPECNPDASAENDVRAARIR